MVYQFRCSVCEGKFTSKGSWLRHLLEPVHSDLARAELIKNWSREETRQCLIVAYSKEAVGKDGRILQFFSKDRYKGIVTDFVWWKERPGIGFIQFESRKVAKSMMASLDNHQIVLKQFQFRRADKFLDLEWDELLPFPPERVDENKDPSPKVTEPIEDPLQKKQPEGLKQKPRVNDDTGKSYNSFLQDLLDYVKSQVKIPCKRRSWAVKASHNLRRILSQGDTKIINEGEEISVSVIRGWGLGLKYHSYVNDIPFVAVKIWNKSDGHLVDYGKKFTFAKVANLFLKDAHVNASKFRICSDPRFKPTARSRSGMKIKFTSRSKGAGTTRIPFSVDFTLSGNFLLAEEIQLWYLAHYLLSFDERCDAIMQIVYFWANLNSIKIRKEKFADSESRKTEYPNWIELVWMVLFFLYASVLEDGRKIIPTPSEILDGNGHHHEPVYFGRAPNQVDIGFTPDEAFKDSWQKKNEDKNAKSTDSVDMFNLVYKFFCFWDGFSEESWVINSREGKYYKSEEFLELKVDQNDPSNKDFLNLQDTLGERLKEWKEKNMKHRGVLHMSSPFNIYWRNHLSPAPDALNPFKVMKNMLQVFLNQLETSQFDVNVNPDSFVHSLFKIEGK